MPVYELDLSEQELLLLEDLLHYARDNFEADSDAVASEFASTVETLAFKMTFSRLSSVPLTQVH